MSIKKIRQQILSFQGKPFTYNDFSLINVSNQIHALLKSGEIEKLPERVGRSRAYRATDKLLDENDANRLLAHMRAQIAGFHGKEFTTSDFEAGSFYCYRLMELLDGGEVEVTRILRHNKKFYRATELLKTGGEPSVKVEQEYDSIYYTFFPIPKFKELGRRIYTQK